MSESKSPSLPAGPRIALLPEVVRNQIAAGEVIERPASVVKELIENALDAGATNIRVDLEEGGVRLVRVTDDGWGMQPSDLELAFQPHATSKLRSPEDLLHIASLGFRGEALASMGSIARCSIFSRPEGTTGARVEVEGGREVGVRDAGGPPGTTVEVRDLFYNTPARRRFLKRTSTELSRCLEVIQRAALAHEGIGFVVMHGGKRVYDVEPDMELLARIRRTFGPDLADALEPVEATDDRAGTPPPGAPPPTTVRGFVAPPRFSRRDTTRQLWFLNGRFLRDKVLTRVLREAYRGFLVEGRQPVAILHLSIDPALVDVNVHPAKSEVRFRDGRRVFGFLVEKLREAIARTDMSTPGTTMLESAARRERREDPNQSYLPRPGGVTPLQAGGRERHETRIVDLPGPAGTEPTHAPPGEREATPPDAPGDGDAPVERAGGWKEVDDLAGPYLQIARTYLVRRLPDGFEIVDQHALHERMTFELMRRDVREQKVEMQRYLVPELIEVSPADLELLSGHLESLARIGIELSPFGEKTIAVQGLPARLRHPDAEGVVRDLIEVLSRTGKAPDAEDVIEEVLHSAACRSSVMAGDELSDTEIESLLRRAREVGETDQTCPHARPTRVKFTLEDLEKAFHRR